MIHVAIIEDQAMVRGALAALLSLEHDIIIVGEAESVSSARKVVAENRPDIVLMDIELQDGSGIDVIAGLSPQYSDTRFIVITTYGKPGYLRAALDAGAVGFLLKDSPATALAAAIRQVHAGARVVDPDLAVAALSLGPNLLTPRQRDVLRLTRNGRSIAIIAEELCLTEGTVRNYLSEAIAVTQASNRVEAAHIAEARGWLD